MRKDKMIQLSYDLLKEKSGKTITVTELAEHTGWTLTNARTNISKRIKQFVDEDKKRKGIFKVKPNIIDTNYSDYSSLFKQADVLVRDYDEHYHPDVVVYELFMPLTCEDKLKRALDNLFYKDKIYQKLQILEEKQLREIFKPKEAETKNMYLDRICQIAGSRFGGYSISHVSGRFRCFKLMSKSDAWQASEEKNTEYLMDETTAIVKFIIPLSTTEELVEDQIDGLPLQMQMELHDMEESVENELKQIQWLFRNLFMTIILNTVGQEEIWVLESGKRSQLTRFVDPNKES